MSVTFRPSSVQAERPPVDSPVLKTTHTVASSDVAGTYTDSFLRVCASAYDHHYPLILTPDAVWLMIMTQFAVYVEFRASHLRDTFVSHSGKKDLKVHSDGDLFTADYAAIATMLVSQMKGYLNDGSLAEWAIPDFSTTTADDRLVGTLCLMAGMKHYFSYSACMRCGLPQVTLLGTPHDWDQLRLRARRLLEFDAETGLMQKWYSMLDPILEQFALSSQGQPDLSWWNQITNHISHGSGPSIYSGWLTVFSVFDEFGRWCGKLQPGDKWPRLDAAKMATCMVEVPLTVDDRGKVYKTTFSAGLSSYRVEGDAIKPISSWSLTVIS
jgi:hypothetical protein